MTLMSPAHRAPYSPSTAADVCHVDFALRCRAHCNLSNGAGHPHFRPECSRDRISFGTCFCMRYYLYRCFRQLHRIAGALCGQTAHKDVPFWRCLGLFGGQLHGTGSLSRIVGATVANLGRRSCKCRRLPEAQQKTHRLGCCVRPVRAALLPPL